jgi:hypothetical protein
VDQALELQPPDVDARRRFDVSRLDSVLERTEGATASFLKELLRRAAVLAAESDGAGPLAVSADDLDAALEELLDTRNAMTRVLLGGRKG